MRHIRPHKLFNLVETSSHEQRMVRIVLPEQRSPILLESAVLLALAKLVQPRTFFEFGTFLGIETLNIAANLSPDARVYTLDLDEAALEHVHQDEPDKPLTKLHMEMQHKLAFLGSPYEKKISRLHGDSTRFDFSKFARGMDMVYVDGGHDLRTEKSDTENAFAMLSKDHPACVAWHDFGNPKHPEVGPYLLQLSTSKELFHVEETMIAFSLVNAPELVAKLRS